MESLTPIEWQVLRLTAGAPENLEQIHDQLRNSPWKAPLADAADAVRSLVEKGLLEPSSAEPARPPEDPGRYWRSRFEATGHGKEVLANPGAEPPPRRSLLGIYAGRMPDVPFEVFKENRREMSRKYAEDFFDE